MRISTATAYDITVDQLAKRQQTLSEAQLRLTSGKRVAKASDDPINAARAERALDTVSRAAASQRSVEASRSAMTLTESAMGDAGELLQQAREALVAGGDASYDDKQRSVLSDQIRALRNQLLAVANRSDGNGGLLFGGQGSSAPPFIDGPGGVTFAGTRGASGADRNEDLPMTADGAATWLSAPTGNGVFETRSLVSTGSAWIESGSVTDPSAITGATYSIQFSGVAPGTTYSVLKDGNPTALTNLAFSAGQSIQVDGMAVTVNGQPAAGDTFELAPSTPSLSVFDVLDKAAIDLAAPLQSGSQKAQSTADNLRNIDAVLGRMQLVRATAGEALNGADSVESHLGTSTLNAKAERSAAEDLDMTQGISDFQNQQTGYEAALKAYASVQRLSLFDFIKT